MGTDKKLLKKKLDGVVKADSSVNVQGRNEELLVFGGGVRSKYLILKRCFPT